MGRLLGSVVMSACLSVSAPGAPLTVHLLTNKPSPQPVGTPIGLAPRVENAEGMQVFRYSVSVDRGPFRILRDFSQQREFVWTPALYEHQATVRVTVRDKTKKTAQSELPFRIVSRVKGASPVITPTAHPLVALFTSPPCPAGSQFRVAFKRNGEATSRTPLQPCRGSLSNNVYVAGMRGDADYQLRAELVNGSSVEPGSWMPFHTGILDGDFPPVSIPVPRSGESVVPEPILVHSTISMTGLKRPFATDMNGEIVWYLRSPGFLTRVLAGGRFLTHSDGPNSVNMIQRLQVLQEFDVAGNVIRETNIGRVAEQLEERGIHSDCRKGGKECVPGFHHEAIRLPNGHTLAITGLERLFPAGTQGSKEPVDIVGDLVVELDEDFQVVAVWNSFDHLDINRQAADHGTCKEGPGDDGCPPIFLAAEAKEWLHSNSLNYIPVSGDFLISMPTQNWVAKIDWKNGRGTGKVLWRLGAEGDFQAKTDDPNPWFSYQHDSGFDPPGSNVISILDNSTLRHSKDPKANTRGQAWKIDEESRTATLVHNADLGVYAVAVGSAHMLKSGGYTFEAGFINPGSVYSRAVETSKDGKVVYAQQLDGVIEYRSFRIADMYSAPGK